MINDWVQAIRLPLPPPKCPLVRLAFRPVVKADGPRLISGGPVLLFDVLAQDRDGCAADGQLEGACGWCRSDAVREAAHDGIGQREGFWLMYLVFAVVLNFVLNYALPL